MLNAVADVINDSARGSLRDSSLSIPLEVRGAFPASMDPAGQAAVDSYRAPGPAESFVDLLTCI